jgi:hypothetical protein
VIRSVLSTAKKQGWDILATFDHTALPGLLRKKEKDEPGALVTAAGLAPT